jgi:hypothetical protein
MASYFYVICCLVFIFSNFLFVYGNVFYQKIRLVQSNEHSPIIIDLQKEHCAIHLHDSKTILLFNISTIRKNY